jgi:hypothetical protein
MKVYEIEFGVEESILLGISFGLVTIKGDRSLLARLLDMVFQVHLE